MSIVDRVVRIRSWLRTGAVMLAAAAFAACTSQVRPVPKHGDVYDKYLAFSTLVDSGDIEPRWLGAGDRFWYPVREKGQQWTRIVDAATCGTEAAFTNEQLRAALPGAAGAAAAAGAVAVMDLKTSEGGKSVALQVGPQAVELALPALAPKGSAAALPERPRAFRDRYPAILPPLMEVPSPDGKRFVFLRDANLWIRTAGEAAPRQLTKDGRPDYEWDANDWTLLPWAKWSADGRLIVTTKYDRRRVHKIPVVDWVSVDEKVNYVPYPLVGDPMPGAEVYVVDTKTGKQTRLQTGEGDHYLDVIGFRGNGAEVLLATLSRDSKRMDVLAINANTGARRTVLTEQVDTYLTWTPFFMAIGAPVRLLADGRRLIVASERSGWRHFYLYDIDSGSVRQLTDGEYPVVDMPTIDERAGIAYYAAHSDPARPYDRHLHKVSLSGGPPQRLTEPGTYHLVSLSPSFRTFVDKQSRVDLPTQAVLRRTEDGSAVCTLAQTNIARLRATGWVAPETFTVKAADGTTGLHGVIYKPYDFDPKKKYPVVEYVYGGPQIAVGQRSFAEASDQGQAQLHWGFPRALAQRGYVVVVLDARGTPGRSKAFHDVVYRDIDQHVVADHAAGLKQLLAQRPYLDAGRVGVFGVSFGGYFTVRFMLQAGDLYKVAVASGPVEMGPEIRQSGPESYLGLYADNPEAYQKARNGPLASRLQGELRIIIGTDDMNTPLSHSLKLADAFVRAERPFEMVVMPGYNHMFTSRERREVSRYWLNAITAYFDEHLRPESAAGP